MADSGNASSGSGEGHRGGVCLSEHSPLFAATRQSFESTPSSTDGTARDSKSSSDVFTADLSNQNSQLHPGDYQLPQPPKFQQAKFTFNDGREGSQHVSNVQIPGNFSAGKASVRSEGTVFATPVGRSVIEPTASGYRSGPPPSITPYREFGPITPDVKTPGQPTPGSLNNSIRRNQSGSGLATISEEKNKSTHTTERGQTKKIIAEMATHCQIDGPLVGPLRESRRSELARNHPAWVPARQVQAGIMTTQQAIRRTPGIPSKIANDLCEGLQKYAQQVNNVLRQAVNEVADIKIDLEYNDKVLCSSKLEASIITEEREQLKRDIAEYHRKYEDLEDRLARYHVEQENHKNTVLEFLARLDPRNGNDEEAHNQTISELLQILKDFMNRPSSRWMHGERNDDSSKAITALSSASIAALEKQTQPGQAHQQPYDAHASQMSESREVMPSANNALQPFNYQQNAEKHSALVHVPAQNGPPSSYPGMFGNARRPADNRTMSSAGWTRASSGARTQHNIPPPGSYSRSGDTRNYFTGGYDQFNDFDAPGGFGSRFDMIPSRPGTSMGNRGAANQHTSFRPNAPEFHPGMNGGIDHGFDSVDSSYNLGYSTGSNAGSRRDFNGGSGPYTSPTPRSATRSTFGNFEGPYCSRYRGPPQFMIPPQDPRYNTGPNHMVHNKNEYVMAHQNSRTRAPSSSGHSYHTANYPQQGGFSPGRFGQGGNGPSRAVTSPFAPDHGFSEDEGGENERYARAFEGVWGLARG
ncbi:uncharacterized protein LY79DRAFT_509811 [Colletotrichum navitas]|uniref:Uncharacterized protein n=1 Tax=Colletotrichum navitas TaxID=681940 RepID=A0AAD8Q679_9PEZI|nr:uncharacterized protein LY79DRAFT_509811 [Colletotrichum navitas]KAK1596021.1 hypothetical protein LY79DRAFT_509811 [Colletotrichum navitas]